MDDFLTAAEIAKYPDEIREAVKLAVAARGVAGRQGDVPTVST